MKNLCYETLNIIEAEINKKIGFSYNILDKLKEQNLLDQLIELSNVPNYLKDELNIFLDILTTDIYNDFPYIRKILLHESNFVEIYKKFGYIISLYVNNKNCYRVFPLFIKELINKLEMDKYKNIPIEEIINTRMDLDYGYNPNLKRDLIEVVYKTKNYYTDYSKYENKIRDNSLNIHDQIEFFIYSEKQAYMLEYNELKNFHEYNLDCIVRWVSKDHGDGYGFDVLSYDPILKKQKLIEVKSGKSTYFELTSNEFKVAQEAMQNNCDYYIYRYYYDITQNIINFFKLKYNENNFIDVQNPNNIFDINPYNYVQNNIQKMSVAIVPKEKTKKIIQI